MNYITPMTASVAAAHVYNYRKGNNFSREIIETNRIFKDNFVFGKDARFKGFSGDSTFYAESGFGVIGRGIESRQNEAIVIIRGTASLHDLVTDANIGTRMNASGNRVHEGFDRSFQSFKQELSRKLPADINTVHIIGHSLGGALATLTAEWLQCGSREKSITPSVYTFGAPRVGCINYASAFTKKIENKNIFRVYNRQDPVSMVPAWPFSHYPMPGNGLYVGEASMVNIFKHKMKHYTHFCKAVDWQTLRNKSRMNTVSDQMIENWLDDGVFHGFDNGFVMAHAAVNYVINQTFKYTGVNSLAALSDSFTALDRLAYVLEQASRVSKEVEGLVRRLLKKFILALGHQVNIDVNVSATVIKWVFESMERAIYYKAMAALKLPE